MTLGRDDANEIRRKFAWYSAEIRQCTDPDKLLLLEHQMAHLALRWICNSRQRLGNGHRGRRATRDALAPLTTEKEDTMRYLLTAAMLLASCGGEPVNGSDAAQSDAAAIVHSRLALSWCEARCTDDLAYLRRRIEDRVDVPRAYSACNAACSQAEQLGPMRDRCTAWCTDWCAGLAERDARPDSCEADCVAATWTLSCPDVPRS